MASELITGFAGAPHVGSDDMGAFQAGILGTGSYVLQTGQQLKATVASANKVTIGTGDLVMNGRHVRMATATDLTIQNGTQGQKRNDLIVCRYRKASDGKETATLVVVKGTATSGTPADPSYNKTSILDGATTSDMPLYRIPITNLSVGTPVQLFKVLTPLDTVGDSVTLNWRLYSAAIPIVKNSLAGGRWLQRHVTFNQPFKTVLATWVNGGDVITTGSCKNVTESGMDVFVRNNDSQPNSVDIFAIWYALGII